MNINPQKDPLDAALGRWRVSSPLPPHFQEHVWRRIADAAAKPAVNPWQALQEWLNLAFARPAVAMACVSVLLLAGSATGWWQAHQKSLRVQDELSSRYVRSLDPYQKMQM